MNKKRIPSKNQALEILVSREVPVGTVIDVGVLKGTPELVNAYGGKKHVLFEPVAEMSGAISTAYAKLDYELYDVAVGNRVGEVCLRISKATDGVEITHSRMTDDRSIDDESSRFVDVVTLDGFLQEKQYEKPYLLKIDIDGQELKVLQGASETLAECSIVIIECQKAKLVERIAAVQAAGFELFDLCEPCYYDQAFWQCDAVFVRSDIFNWHFIELKGKVLPGKYEVFRG